ncbi:ABC transporter permease [Chlorobium sp.]|uniref:ABC transporter permease n=2 Tax=Chlorobium sp. TaxID=1095 RepID=UPI0025BAB054|nr:ABC transporter permease [Chlorobium sp.]
MSKPMKTIPPGELLQQALSSLGVNRLRSWLTTLGVAVGVFSIISVMTALDAIDKSVESGLTSLGANTFQIQKTPATVFGSGHSRNRFINRKDITYRQAQAFRKLMQGKAKNIGFIITRPAIQAKYGNRSTNPDVTMTGGDEQFAASNGYDIREGRNLGSGDIQYGRNMVVLGGEVADRLFPAGDSPIGRQIRLNTGVYTVIGVFAKKGAAFGQSQDNLALIPITHYLDHIDEKSSLSITVEAFSQKEYPATLDQAVGAMRLARGLTVSEANDFDIRTNDSLIDSFRDIQRIISSGAFIISFMALLTAGVGIMNIMLVSVTERTREIGIRKSIGAPRSSIRNQFLIEALVLSLTGGVIGIAAGVGAGNIIAVKLNLPMIFPWLWISISITVCSAIGMGFGIFPAWKAAGLDPVEALRPK